VIEITVTHRGPSAYFSTPLYVDYSSNCSVQCLKEFEVQDEDD